MWRGGFVFARDVDGHFQRAGFTESDIAEFHGSSITCNARSLAATRSGFRGVALLVSGLGSRL